MYRVSDRAKWIEIEQDMTKIRFTSSVCCYLGAHIVPAAYAKGFLYNMLLPGGKKHLNLFKKYAPVKYYFMTFNPCFKHKLCKYYLS